MIVESNKGSAGNLPRDPALDDVAFDMTRVAAGRVAAAQQAAQALFRATVRLDKKAATAADLERPALVLPRMAVKTGMDSGASLTGLLGDLMQLIGKGGQAELAGRIEAFQAMAESRRKSLGKESEEFLSALDAADRALNRHTVAQTALKSAKERQQNIAMAQAEQAEQAKAATDDMRVAKARPDDLPERLPAEKTSTQKMLGQLAVVAAQQVTRAEKKVASATENLSQALKSAIDIESRLTAALGKPGSGDRHPDDALAGSMARLTLLMASLTRLLGEANDTRNEGEREAFEEMRSQRQKSLEKTAADYVNQVEKADHLARSMGCVGKIVGAVLTVASLVAAPFTGGASLALAVIGAGLFMADIATAAITGKSLTEMAMDPVMNSVVQPMIALLTKAIVAMLERAGVPAEEAARAGAILAAVLAAVAMIVMVVLVALVGKGAAGKLAAKMAPVMLRSMRRMAPQLVRTLGKASVQRMSGMVNTAGAVIGGAAGVMQGGGTIRQAMYMKRASEHEAEMALSTFTIQQLRRYLTEAVESISMRYERAHQLTKIASSAGRHAAETGLSITRRLRV